MIDKIALLVWKQNSGTLQLDTWWICICTCICICILSILCNTYACRECNEVQNMDLYLYLYLHMYIYGACNVICMQGMQWSALRYEIWNVWRLDWIHSKHPNNCVGWSRSLWSSSSLSFWAINSRIRIIQIWSCSKSLLHSPITLASSSKTSWSRYCSSPVSWEEVSLCDPFSSS